MAKFAVKLDSKELDRQLANALKRNPKVTANTVKAIALDLQGKSAKLAPVDTGDLRNNCNADLSKAKGNNPSATVGYSLPYALRQHEELDYNHPKGGQAKFLEQPFLENKQKYIDKIKNIPDEVLK